MTVGPEGRGIVTRSAGDEQAPLQAESKVRPPSGVGHRLFLGVGASSLNQLVTALGMIVTVPLFMAHWGREAYGEWLTISAAVSYLGLADAGMQMSVANGLGAYHATAKQADYNRLLGHAIQASVLFVSIASLILIAFISSSSITSLLALKVLTPATVSLVALLLGLQVLIALPHGIVLSIYRSVGEYAYGMMIYNVIRMSSLALSAVALMLGLGPSSVAAAQLLPIILSLGYCYLDVCRRYPAIEIRPAWTNLRDLAYLCRPSLDFFLVQITTSLSVFGTTLVISRCLGPSVVVLFVTSRTLINLVRQALCAVNNAAWPELTRLAARGDAHTLSALLQMVFRITLLMAVTGAICIKVGGPFAVAVWTRGGIIVDRNLLDALIGLLLSQAVWLTASTYLLATNQQRVVARLQMLGVAIGLCAAAIIAPYHGTTGVVIAMAAGDLLCCALAIPVLASKQLRGGRFSSDFAVPVLKAAIVYGLVYCAAVEGNRIWPVSTAGLDTLIKTILIGCLSMGLGIHMLLEAHYRQEIMRFLAKR